MNTLWDQPWHTLAAGRYAVGGVLGSGGMALVLDALEMPAREPVAIKVLHRRCAPSAAVQERFAREVALARSLEHPALVAFYDAFEQDGHQFLVMERLQGPSRTGWPRMGPCRWGRPSWRWHGWRMASPTPTRPGWSTGISSRRTS